MKPGIHIFLFLLVMSQLACAQQPSKSEGVKKQTASMQMTDKEWKEKLSPFQYYVLREKGTEKPFSGEFVFTKDKGTYKCAGCGEALFTDEMKFESHCGWPSFDREMAGGKIVQTEDNSHGMHRIEITCAKCGGHLGHIFDDGPTETGVRYCVNSASLTFEPQTKGVVSADTITLGGGCFWCIEAIFDELKGVIDVRSGYSGGKVVNPSYREVCSGTTGHAEVVQISYDPSVISLEDLLEVFFTLHDPTTLNRQGADVGTQYRSVIFYHNENQKKTVQRVIAHLGENKVFDSPIVTEVTAFDRFYEAENYHQEYYALHKEEPYCRMVIQPKMEKLKKVFKNKL
ncbi:MAG: bifunctional methionine sulfoxide reductase B/A protein [Saprospiraceae bacterium]|nr:bifunctional methionine sulfoxide reductase B/A protein [Saprospiraceae bacterium]